MTSDRIICSLALAAVAVGASACAYEVQLDASPCVLSERSAAGGAVLDAVKASCRRQLACSDERIREIVRFSEALVGESGAAKRSADEWQKANDGRAVR